MHRRPRHRRSSRQRPRRGWSARFTSTLRSTPAGSLPRSSASSFPILLSFVLDGGCTEDAPAPPSPPHAAAAAAVTVAATAAGGPPTTDAGEKKKRELGRIPVVVYEAKPGASATDDCVICLGEFDDGDKVCVLPRCRHGFHVHCIDPWLATHPSCPTCRDSLLIQ
ncbi:RING-H2 finger protein ATL74-like [Miscanthus floridulus]|uniref:RING-H2 finger protein ATL74-like n=1 Tax=Miscanthus floridulus TaxID=154761 RepID=UPI003458E099